VLTGRRAQLIGAIFFAFVAACALVLLFVLVKSAVEDARAVEPPPPTPRVVLPPPRTGRFVRERDRAGEPAPY
jgi:hypothetical protein